MTDNAAFHKTHDVMGLISAGNSVLYTAPDPCEHNPIEYVFSVWETTGVLAKLAGGFEMIKRVPVAKYIGRVRGGNH